MYSVQEGPNWKLLKVNSFIEITKFNVCMGVDFSEKTQWWIPQSNIYRSIGDTGWFSKILILGRCKNILKALYCVDFNAVLKINIRGHVKKLSVKHIFLMADPYFLFE